MPLSNFTFNVNPTGQFSVTNTGFGTTTNTSSLPFTLSGLDLTNYQQAIFVQYTISSSSHQDVDLTNLTNFVCEAVTFTSVLSILVVPTGSQCTVTPNVTNGLQWFFGGTTQSVVIPAGGMLAFSDPVGGPGATVNSTNKILRFSNTGGSTMTLNLMILGSTTI